VYAARANRRPLLITGLEQGGQLMTTTDVDNWPGDVEHLQGPALMDRMRRHAERFNTEIVFDHINRVELRQRPFRLFGDNGEYTCDALIIATGASAKYLGCPPRKRFAARAFPRARPATDFSTAARPWRWSAAATPPWRRRCTWPTSPRTSRSCIGATSCEPRKSCRIGCLRSKSAGKVSIVWNHAVDEIFGDEAGVTGCACAPCTAMRRAQLKVDGVFIAVGHQPNTQLFEKQLDMRGGYIVVKGGSDGDATATSVARRVRRGRCGRSRLPPSRDFGRHRLHGGARCRQISGTNRSRTHHKARAAHA
jgi:thioredoxin reductase (NADPH)